jgi:hypothetical protein
MENLLKLARESGIPEVLEAVSTIILQYAKERPESEEGDFCTLANDLKALADKARNNEEHAAGRGG